MFLFGCFLENRIKFNIQETPNLSTCANKSMVWEKFGFILTPPRFKAILGDDPEQKAGTINKNNPENLLVLRLHAGTIHVSNPKHLVFTAPRMDTPCVQAATRFFVCHLDKHFWRLRQILLGIQRANIDLVCEISISSNLI